MEWTERILSFPVRAAAVSDFLRDLRARGSGDLSAVLTTLNDGRLCRETVRQWVERGWIVVAPNSPLVAFTGPAFRRDLTLSGFCGAPRDEVDDRTPLGEAAVEGTSGPEDQ